MSLSKNRGEDTVASERHELRLRIEVLCRTTDELNAFVGDYFNDVFRQYSAEMSRIQRVNLLLEKETMEKVSKCLGRYEKKNRAPPSQPDPPKKKVPPPVCVRLWPPPGDTTIELLDALEKWCRENGEESLRLEHRELHPGPTSNGWRRLTLKLTGDAVILEAFPALFDPGGSPEPKPRVQVPRGATKEASYIYFPVGRGGREYRAFLSSEREVRVSLEPKDQPGRIIFEIAKPDSLDPEVLHEQ